MIEIRLPLAAATMGDLRRFMTLTADVPDDMPVAYIDENDDLWGIAAVIDSTTQPRKE